jgi:hypothetical protein
VGVEVVEHDVDVAVRVIGHDPVHKVEELDPAPAPIVPGPDRARGDVPQDLRPSRSIFRARRKRQTYWLLTSPKAAATSPPVQRA